MILNGKHKGERAWEYNVSPLKARMGIKTIHVVATAKMSLGSYILHRVVVMTV